MIRQKMSQKGDRADMNYVYVSPYPDRLKVYQMPVKTEIQFGSSQAETFNDGDVIEVYNERSIEFKK